MGVLARAPQDRLEEYWADMGAKPDYEYLRHPETGLVMVRGRAGGIGARFNLGEMTLSRCSVRLTDGTVGHGYVAGRAKRHCELAALFDAMLQNQELKDGLDQDLISPLEQEWLSDREIRSRKAGATKVDFYTMVRGEN